MSKPVSHLPSPQGAFDWLLKAGEAANDDVAKTARQVATDRWAKAAVTETVKETVTHAGPGLLGRLGTVMRGARLFTPHGLIAEILLSDSCGDSSPREMRQAHPVIVDQPPAGKPVTQWLAEMQEMAEIASRIANKRNELELARKQGQTARVHALSVELDELYAQVETIASAYPVHGHRLQAMASAAPESGRLIDAQAEQLALERESLAQYRAAAMQRVRNLPPDARILILNLAPVLFDPAQVGDDALVHDLIEHQFGGTFSSKQFYRHMLGFGADDPRLTVWTPATDGDLDLTQLPDIWITTGGPAMPSELHPGNETPNTPWLRRAVNAMQLLQEKHVPGIAVCLGHQLWEYSQGAEVGRVRPQREFGTVTLNATDAGREFPLLSGVWNNSGQTDIMASHSEGVITPPPNPNVQVLASNDYSGYQMALHPLREGQTAAEATAAGEWVLSLQNHPELLALYSVTVGRLRAAAMRAEGLDPDAMVFRDTPAVRNLWLNVLDFVAVRATSRASVAANSSASAFATRGIDLGNLDTSVRPQDDFFRFVNGGWLDNVVLPPGVPGFGNFGALRKANSDRLQATVEAAMQGNAEPGSHQQVLGDFYASGMDVERLNQLGAAPLQVFLKMVEDISPGQPGKLEECVAWLLRHRIPTLFTLVVDVDSKQSDQYVLTLDQGGLGLPERDYYFRDDADSIQLRAAYTDHIVKTFMLLGDSEVSARQKADAVIGIETELAHSSLTPLERRDLERQYNKIPLPQWGGLVPDFDWDGLLGAIKLPEVSHVVVTNPHFFGAINRLMVKAPKNHWQAYLTWQLVNGTSEYLGDAFSDQKFKFFGQTLEGASEPKPRARRVLEQADALIGDALGKVFVDQYFDPKAKQQTDEMVRYIIAAMRDRIATRDWMSPDTKAKASEKLDAVSYKIGHPDQWRDYTSVEISRDAYFQNAMNARAFEFARMVGKLGQPVDRSEWSTTAPTVNALYEFERNVMTFSAGVLQPPFFTAGADPAVNFGAIGAMIGHELTHGFDDQGAQFDARGNMLNWWTAEDVARFAAKGMQLVQQFDGYEIQPGQFVLGKLTLGENIADLGGVAVAYHALQKYLDGKPSVVIDGFTPEQRFFMGYAQMWRAKYTPQFMATNFRKDNHSPARFRVLGPLSNMDAFHQAWGTQPGDAMWRAPEDRIVIW